VRWLRGQTIRGRITLWAVLIAALLISAAAFAFMTGVETIVASSTHTLLTSDGADYEASIRQGTTENFSAPGEDQLLAVVNPKGAVMVSSLPDSLEDRISTLITLDKGLKTVRISDALQYEVINEPVPVQAGTWHIIEARNSDSGQAVLDGLSLLLVFGVILLVAGFGVATRILCPSELCVTSCPRWRKRSMTSLRRYDHRPTARSR
jgi:two-component system OmpR family sensor kinase